MVRQLFKISISLVVCFFLTIGLSFAEFRYQAKIIDVYDADTFTAEIDLGFNLILTEKIRLMGIDTAELRTQNEKEKQLGYKGKEYVSSLILGKTVVLIIYERDKYGRPLADVILPDGKSLTADLIEKGYGYAYDGGTKKAWEL